jgi:AraC-like DNA-binding protein
VENIELYEQIPENGFPLRLNVNKYKKYKFDSHWHEHVEIHCVFEGSAKLRCGEDVVKLQCGDCAVINGNELHGGAGGECGYWCLIIPPEFFGNNHVIFEHLIKDDRLFEMMKEIFSSHNRTDEVSQLEITGRTYLMIAYLIREHSTKNLSEISQRRYLEKLEKVNKAIQYIEKNFTENLTTESLSHMVHLSEGYFCHLFKEVTGRSSKDYILGLRIKKAEKLLASSGMSVTEVCYTCGFSDPNYFSRIFKQRTGKQPSEYRFDEQSKRGNI